MRILTHSESDSRELQSRLRRAGIPVLNSWTTQQSTCPSHPLWVGMPEHRNRPEFYKAFEVKRTASLKSVLEQPLQGDVIHFPARTRRDLMKWCYVTTSRVQPRYPVYVISKGRHDTCLTMKALERMGVEHRVVVEPQERNAYAAVIPEKRLLILPFSNLGQGSIPARNFVWEHAMQSGAKRHWILDDNIRYFFRRNHNRKVEVLSGAIFRAMEDFVDRFSNVPIAGPNYDFFVPDQSRCYTELTLNTRIYSCILIGHHQIDHLRWRGRYNEDTDLCLRALKEGWCTILFNSLLQKKVTTMTMRGGNTDELYKNGRLEFVKSLQRQHPDVVTHVKRYGRDHHSVDYKRFQGNRPVPLRGKRISKSSPSREYGMKLIARKSLRRRTRTSRAS